MIFSSTTTIFVLNKGLEDDASMIWTKHDADGERGKKEKMELQLESK